MKCIHEINFHAETIKDSNQLLSLENKVDLKPTKPCILPGAGPCSG